MKPRESSTQPITGTLSELYDVFIDWPGRLSRELSGLERRLAGARRVHDVTVSGRMDDPQAPVRSEDVFVGARTPQARQHSE